ncbi:diguanylate cyclase domain-containing protein [Lysobacter terrae]
MQVMHELGVSVTGYGRSVPSPSIGWSKSRAAYWMAAAFALSLTMSPGTLHAAPLAAVQEAVASAAAVAYPAERERLRAQIAAFKRNGEQAQSLVAMESLRRLAVANDDPDLAHLMEVERIFATHEDAAIDQSLTALNAVRARVRPQASVELQEALARVYGNLYFDAGNFGLALQHQLDALRLAERLPSGAQEARLHRLAVIAELYNAMELPKQALRYADQALAPNSGVAMPPDSRVSPLCARALALIQLGQLADAARAIDEAERIDAQANPGANTMRVAQARATLQLAARQPTQALQAIERLRALADQFDSHYYRTRAGLLLGQVQIARGDMAGGLQAMRGATAEFERLGQVIDVLDGQQREIQTLRAQRAWPEAVEAMQRREALWSRLFRSGQARAIAELEARHRAEAREQRISALDNEVRLERARIRSERLLMLLAVTLALLAISIAALLYLSRHRARRERDRLSHVVRHDPLTGAYSRYEFQHRNAAADAAATDNGGGAVLLLDVDNFKAINDRHGHDGGDAVLKALVAHLRLALAKGDEIYRWGGEEFLVVLTERDPATLTRDVRALLDSARAPVLWHGQSIPVTLSGGLVRHPLAPGWTAPLADAIRWADAALYSAKRAGRDQVTQVHVTDQGARDLIGHRPLDVAQLEDWQRHGDVELHTLHPTRKSEHTQAGTAAS